MKRNNGSKKKEDVERKKEMYEEMLSHERKKEREGKSKCR